MRTKSAKTYPKITPEPLPGVVMSQMKRCGKANCKCSRGELHGPYYYRFYRMEGKLCREYVKASELERTRKSCGEWKRFQAEIRESRQQWKRVARQLKEQMMREQTAFMEPYRAFLKK